MSTRRAQRTARSGPARRVGRRTRRIGWSVLAVTLVLAGLWSWFAATKIYFPRLDPVPDDVDVLMQVGGASPADFPAARKMAQDNDIPHLVISEPTGVQSFWDSYCAPLRVSGALFRPGSLHDPR